MQPAQDLTTVATYLNPWDAHVMRSLLESEGIAASLAGEHHVWANWQWSLALGGVRLQVPVRDVDIATEILSRYANGEFEAALQDELKASSSDSTDSSDAAENEQIKPATCPHCGSTHIEPVGSVGAMATALGILFLLGVIVPQHRDKKCGACGKPVPKNVALT
ncbi:hypothetical protein H8L32_17025 [Undibacterium sp. CY18W]|uniref:Signal transducing protein n=1 Tax=Undibacterium hunanense TaxID=2762292 RepID=A0ABR6ZTH9_9BURK|nr:hypothetical protein [Undibacterium hunanense]MBC3919198.1 hypothetical protein [Undibacterium hunanense]